MNCSKIQNLLSAYMDGEVTGEEQLQIRRHLEICEDCSGEHASLLKTKRMIGGLTARQPRPEMEQYILDALSAEEQKRTRRSPLLSWWLTLPHNRRVQFAGAFAVFAVALAAARIAPVLLAPPRDATSANLVAQMQSPRQRALSPVRDLLYIYNPADNAPVRGNSEARPISMQDYSRSAPR